MNQSQFLSAHTAWLRADLMRRHWNNTGRKMDPRQLDNSVLTKEPIIYLFLWHALLFVVIEFLQEKLAIPPALQSDADAAFEALKKRRNAIFHAQDEYISPKLVFSPAIPNEIDVVNRLHSELGLYLNNPANQPSS